MIPPGLWAALYGGLRAVLFIGRNVYQNVPYLCLICRKQLEMVAHECK